MAKSRLDILIEFKYVASGKNKLDGERVRNMPHDELTELAAVKRTISEAKRKLGGYRQTLLEIYGDRLRLHAFVVVEVGFDRLVWEKA